MTRHHVKTAYGKRGSRITRGIAAGLLLCLALGACSEPMAAISEIDKFRIMAVQVEPPEIRPGESATHRALFADPHGEGREVTLLWATLLGELSEKSTDGSGGMLGTPGMTFGDDTYTVTVPADVLEGIPEETAELRATTVVILCAGGVIDLQSIEEVFAGGDLSALTGDSDLLCQGGDMLTAFKQFRISNKGDDQRNTNPTIDWLKLDGNILNPVDEESPEGGEDIGVFTCTDVDKCLEGVPLAALLTENSYQTYELEQFGEVETVSDDPYISWFVTGGHFSNDRSRPVASNQTFKVTWAPPLMGGTFTLWAVAHDLRGGTSWKRYTVKGITPDST